jgi:two-component system response regulator AtoC
MTQMLRTLIVDDEEDLRDILEMMLTRIGVEVKLASNGKEAIELLKKEEIDLVISDISMPIMDGVTLLTELRNLTISQPHFIFISGGIEFDENKKKLIESQTDGVISKPFQAEQILDCFSRIFPSRNFNKI